MIRCLRYLVSCLVNKKKEKEKEKKNTQLVQAPRRRRLKYLDK